MWQDVNDLIYRSLPGEVRLWVHDRPQQYGGHPARPDLQAGKGGTLTFKGVTVSGGRLDDANGAGIFVGE